ncbi:MAG TPA: hypothetical protein PLH46_07150, partial [Caldisericia bacterium]|nr:hypothetical protein [Caldisericia bacterium]
GQCKILSELNSKLEFDGFLHSEEIYLVSPKDIRLKILNSEISKIDELISKLNETWSVISTELYKNAQSQGATDDTSSAENVEDTSYEEVS